MDSLKNSLDVWMRSKQMTATAESHEDIWKHPDLLRWWQSHPEWSKEELSRFLIKLKQFTTEQDHCTKCAGLDACPNMMKGHYPSLLIYGKFLDLEYSPCSFYKQAVEEQKRQTLIHSHQIPKEILQGSLREFDQSDGHRLDAFRAVLEFCSKAEPGKNGIGLYLHGPLGVGKSYLLGAACNKLAERGISSYMVYSPDFFREMKGAIAEQKVEEKINALKDVPVLIFDDMGAETMSPWARDEVLGSILQHRVMEKLPTLYTSNYSYAELEEHLAYSYKSGVEELKAKRIMERIRHYTDAYFIKGKNRRERSN